MEEVLYQFPMREIRFYFPGWVETLEDGHWLKKSLVEGLKEIMGKAERLADVPKAIVGLENKDFLKKVFRSYAAQRGCCGCGVNV